MVDSMFLVGLLKTGHFTNKNKINIMETMFNYYSLDECTDLDFVTNFLNDLKNEVSFEDMIDFIFYRNL